VVIEGAAGIGKSSVLDEGRIRAADAGMTVLSASGSEYERAFAYGVVRQLFEARLSQATPEQRARVLDGAAAHAARLVDPRRLAEPAPATEDAAFALLHGLYWLTLNLAESGPLLIVIDDLQWADPASLRWLTYLVRRLDGAAVGVLAAVRPSEDEDAALAELLAGAGTTRVRPSALTEPAVAELVRTVLPAEADESFCVACHRTTGGNPLLLRDLLGTLADEGIAPTAGAVVAVERLAPDAVARSVKLRLSRLPSDAAALARAVATLGDGTDPRLAAALAGISRRAVLPAAGLLAGVGLLQEERPLRFVHPVLRNAVYETTPPEIRLREHARAASALTSAAAPAEQIAAQLLLAPPEAVANAVPPLREAAWRAAAEGAPESAVRYLRRALDEPTEDQQRAELLLELASTELRLGAPGVADHLREAVVLLEDPERRLGAQLQLGRALYWAGREAEGVRILEAALNERQTGDDDLQRRLEAELIANATRIASQYQAARRRLDKLEVTADEGPGARMLLGMQAYHEAALGGSRELVIHRAGQALAAMDDEERAWNYTPAIYALLWADSLDEALRFLDPLIAAGRSRGAVFNFSGLSMTRAIFRYARGELVEAEADARMALDALPHRNAWFILHAHCWLAQILVERGALDEAAAVLGSVDAGVSVASDPFSRTPLLRAHTTLAAAAGDHRRALEDALELGRGLAAFGHDNPALSYPPWRSSAALAHHALGEPDAALSLARDELELARSWEAPRPLGRSLRVLGLIEGGNDGIQRLREAVAILENSPARLEHAYAMTNLAPHCGAAIAEPTHAKSSVRHSSSRSRLGAQVLAERAHDDLVATGARPRRLLLSGVHALTPSERRVAALAAEGLSNREIAQALFVTLRTVEMHLSNVFRKLDISSRTQLPAALAAAPDESVPATV
jgi:DNA-binding CsgD family transcriptional regulator